jgi:hypothetical protein
MIVLSLAGTFLAMSFTRTIAAFAVDKCEDIPELGNGSRATKEDEELLVGPLLARFDIRNAFRLLSLGPVYTWPMPPWVLHPEEDTVGIRDMSDLVRSRVPEDHVRRD